MSKTSQRYHTYIHTAPAPLWEALTSAVLTRQYFDFMEGFMSVDSSWQAGTPITYRTDDGQVQIEGEIRVAEPPIRLTTTFSLLYDDKVRSEPASELSWEITTMDEVCRLTVTHQPNGAIGTAQDIGICMPSILSNLRILLETGKPRLIKEIVVDCASPALLGTFWASALGYVMQGPPPMQDDAFVAIADPSGVGPELGFQRVPEPKTVKNRLHFDLNVIDRAAEVERLVAQGARRAPGYPEGWFVMLDPEGNEFCVVGG